MFLLIIVFFTAFIVIPLADLSIAERIRVPVKIGIYALAFIYILYVLIVGKAV